MLLAVALAMTALTTSFDVSGVHVILRKNDANNVVAANLYLLGGARQVTEATDNHRIRQVSPGGTISTVAGTGLATYSGDNVGGTGISASSGDGKTRQRDRRCSKRRLDAVRDQVQH